MTLRQHRRNRPPGAPPDLFGSQSKSSYPLQVVLPVRRHVADAGSDSRALRPPDSAAAGVSSPPYSRARCTAMARPSPPPPRVRVQTHAALRRGGQLIRFSAGAVVVHREPQPRPVSSRIDSHDAARAAAGIAEQVAQHRLQGRLLQRLLAGLVVACSGILPLRESATGSPTGGTRRPTFPRAAVPRATGFRLRPCRAQGARRPVPPHAE
jgi:hypothetical protein